MVKFWCISLFGPIFILLSGLAFAKPSPPNHAPAGSPIALHEEGSSIARFIVNYSDLRKEHSECNSDDDSRRCMPAAHRFCQSREFSSGIGLVNTHFTGGEIICTSSAVGREIHTTFNQLSTYLSLCDRPSHARLDVCQAAVKRFCTANNFGGGGFGPLEYNDTVAVVFCVNNQNGTEINTSYTVLTKFDESCSSPSVMASISCLRAADKYCQSEGFSAAQPLSETGAVDNKFFCLGEGKNTTDVQPQFEDADLGSREFTPSFMPSSLFREVVVDRLDNGPMAQLPNDPSLFLMRQPNSGDDAPHSLVLAEFNWGRIPVGGTRARDVSVSFNKTVLKTPFRVFDDTRNETIEIYSAYDPSVISFEGHTWVAFECVAFRLIRKNGELIRSTDANPNIETSSSTCIGPLYSNNRIAPSKVKVLVSGRNFDTNKSETNAVSASVPKLFTHQGKPYLYWTTVNQTIPHNNPNGRVWVDVQTRGVELSFNHDENEFFVKGHKGEIFEANHPDAVVILDSTFRPDPNDRSFFAEKVADIYDVTSDGIDVYMTAGVSNSCLEPNGDEKNCYRIAMAKSNSPLRHRGFNAEPLGVFPDQSGAYFTFVKRLAVASKSNTSFTTPARFPDLFITGTFLENNVGANNTYENNERHIINVGNYIDPIEYGVCVNKYPDWANFNGSCLPQCDVVDTQRGVSAFLTEPGQSCADGGLVSAGVSAESRSCCMIK